jgi:hypothetical protein
LNVCLEAMVLALVLVQKVALNLLDSLVTLGAKKTERSNEIYDLFGTLQDSGWTYVSAVA